jgi:hypothetical protein
VSRRRDPGRTPNEGTYCKQLIKTSNSQTINTSNTMWKLANLPRPTYHEFPALSPRIICEEFAELHTSFRSLIHTYPHNTITHTPFSQFGSLGCDLREPHLSPGWFHRDATFSTSNNRPYTWSVRGQSHAYCTPNILGPTSLIFWCAIRM